MEAVKRLLTHPLTVRACQLAIGVIFGAAGLAKLGNLPAFAYEIHNFRIIPIPTENVLAMTLPWIEILMGLALVLGIRERAAAVLSALLMTVFTLAVVQALVRDLNINCGCFGKADAQAVGLKKLAENLGMLAVAVVASLRTR